jgi:hypothetical protein
MKRLLLTLALLCVSSIASAQCNGVFANNTVCGNITGASNLPRPTSPSAFLGAAGGTNGQTQYNSGGALAGYTPSQDCTVVPATGVFTCLRTNNILFAPSATTDTTNAGNISSGLLATARGGTGVSNATSAAGDILTSQSTNGTFLHTAFNAVCTLAPSACTTAFGYTSIAWYGAKCDGIYQSNQNADQPSTNLSITSGLKALTSSGSTFTSADVGKRIWVPGAGVAGAGLSSTITAFTDATHVTINDAASTTLVAVAATNALPFVYGTDDTTAIQAAMTATPIGGSLFIPGQHTGCIIRQQGANTYALNQDHPFSVTGTGHWSNLMTFPDTPSTVNNYVVNTTGNSWDWSGVVWSGFSIGASPSFFPTTLLMYQRYGKRGLALLDNPSFNFVSSTIRLVGIGESGNDYSLYIGNGTSSASTNILIEDNYIFGGIQLEIVSDSFRIVHNRLAGSSTKGGLFSFVGGAGLFEFSGNNVTWAGGTKIEGGTKPVFLNNYFEELYATSESNNAMVDFNGGVTTVAAPTFMHNIVGAIVSSTSTPVRYNNVSNGVFGDNYISTSTVRTGVTSTTQLSCTAPNVWNSASPHFSTALASPNPFSC